jgi:hypothetical protein
MSKATTGRRLLIDESVCLKLTEATKRIKSSNDYVRINEGKLATEILKLFFSKYFEKDYEQISGKFFNKKLFLKNLISSSNSDEELIESFNKFIKKPVKKRGRPKKVEFEDF